MSLVAGRVRALRRVVPMALALAGLLAPPAATARGFEPSPGEAMPLGGAGEAKPAAPAPEVPAAPAPAAPTPRPPAPTAVERGVERLRASDWSGAAAALAEAHAVDPADLDVALLLGVACYRLGRTEAAARHLLAATRAADEETRAAARILLAVIAAERGATDVATPLLRAAAASSAPALAEAGRELLARAVPRRLALTLVVRPEFDSNVPQLPGTTTPASFAAPDRADGDVLLLAAIAVRPAPAIGLSIEELATYRQQFRLTDWSLFLNAIGPRYRWAGLRDRVAVGYDFETQVLGGNLLSLGHVAQAGYAHVFGGAFTLGARYLCRYRDYRGGFAPFSGAAHQGAVEAAWGTPDQPRELGLAALVVRDGTADETFAATGGGARAFGRVRIARRADLTGSAWFVGRAFDPASSGRVDWQAGAEIAAAVDVARWLSVLAGAAVLRNVSNAPDFDYLKVTAWLGVATGWAGL